MSAFNDFYNINLKESGIDYDIAKRIWNTAQRIGVHQVLNPSLVPKTGDNIKILNLAHPKSLGKVKRVISVTKEMVPMYWVETQDDEGNYSSGILGEIEIMN